MNTDDIILIGLISGETVIGQTGQQESGNSIHLTKPVQIVQMADEKTDRMVPAMVPYAPFAEKGEILVSPTAIAYIAVPKTKLAEEYKTMLSPIIQPNKSIITTA
jgi:hypothetical protein